jgi:RimJ/RimL family protein N-acetyltransferase
MASDSASGPESAVDGVSFRRLRRSEIPLIHRWLHTPHVARWWYEDVGTLEEVEERYLPYVEGKAGVEPYLILREDTPIGYIQTYPLSADEEYAKLVGVEDATGVDLFIGEPEFLYKGLGPNIIRRFLRDIVFSDGRYETCVIGPEPKNESAIRAYGKVGFRYFKTARVPGEPEPEYLMKLTREEFFEG